jgi:predicted transcriptional regulator with HTH domain
MLSELFSSKTRIQILLKLFLNADLSCYLRELAKEFKVAPSTLKPELDSLSQAGYLSKKQNGRSILFRANTKHPLFPEIHSIVKKSLGIDKVIENVKNNLGQVEAVYILDDYANGKDSGLIDLLIVGDVDQEKLAKYVQITENKIGRKVRVLVESTEEFVSRQDMYFSRPHWKVV